MILSIVVAKIHLHKRRKRNNILGPTFELSAIIGKVGNLNRYMKMCKIQHSKHFTALLRDVFFGLTTKALEKQQ